MGASRQAEARRASEPRRRNRTSHHEPIRIGAQDETRLGRDPFAALAGLRIKPPFLSVRQIALRYFVRSAA
jgi:hypothetical protein